MPVLGSELAQRAPGSLRRYVTVHEPPLPDAAERHYALYFHWHVESPDALPGRGTAVEITGVADVGSDRCLLFEHPADDLRLLWRAINTGEAVSNQSCARCGTRPRSQTTSWWTGGASLCISC